MKNILRIYQLYLQIARIIKQDTQVYRAFSKSYNFTFFSVTQILIPILTTRKDGKLYAQFLEKNWDGINGEMYST